MRRLLPNAFLLLMLVFLLPVYLAKQRPDVLGLSVLLLAAAFFVGYTDQPRALEILAGMTAVLSFVGMAFLGQLVAGPNGGYCFVGLWILALLGLVALFYRRAVLVERGQILVVNQLPENRALIWTEGLHRPLRPFVERRMAALPSYELDIERSISGLNTHSPFNVDEVTVLARYRVVQPRETVFGFPNREQAYATLAAEQQAPEDTDTAGQVAFWSELIRRQMSVEIEQALRIVVAGVDGPAEVASEREALARTIKQRLQASVARWGIQVLDLRLLDVKVDPERLRVVDSAAGAAATARMVAAMVQTLQQQGASLGSEEIERIVLTALQRAGTENTEHGI